MINSDKEYLVNLIAGEKKNWEEPYERGLDRGKDIDIVKSRFLREKNLRSEVDLRLERVKENAITWRTIMGLASIEDQVEGHKYLYSFGERTGVYIDAIMVIPNILTGVPKEKREGLPKGTSFVLSEPKDWAALSQAAPIQPAFCDFQLGSPNSAENTYNSIKNGTSYLGVFAQFSWDYPGCNDDYEHISSIIEALGMAASKRNDKVVVDTYLDDGIASYFLDMASYLGYARLEKYIISDLCKARYACSFGQLMDKIIPKMSLWLALSDVLKEEDQPGVSYIFSNCIDHWDHDLEANYGVLCSEVLIEVLIEKKYKTGISILPIPITEKVAVPTPEAIANIHAAARRVEEKSDEWESLIDFDVIEKTRDVLKESGLKFFENILEGLEAAGVDINNPLEMLMILKRVNPSMLEKLFHPSTYNTDLDTVDPKVPTSMAKRSLDEKDAIIENVKDTDNIYALKDKRVLVASGDAHWYGMFVVGEVLSGIGMDVSDGGVGLDPVDLLDLADEEGLEIITISVHNGQALDYAKQLVQLSEIRGKKYYIFMGGKLNGIIGNDSEPTDVTQYIEELGINTSDTVEELVNKLLKVDPIRG